MANASPDTGAAKQSTERTTTAASRAMSRDTLPPPRTLDQHTRQWFGVSSTVVASCLAIAIMLGSVLAMMTAPSRTHPPATPADLSAGGSESPAVTTPSEIPMPQEPVAPTPPPALDPGTSAAPVVALPATASPTGTEQRQPGPAIAPSVVAPINAPVAAVPAPVVEAPAPTHRHHSSHDDNAHASETHATAVAQPSTAPSPHETTAPAETTAPRANPRPARAPTNNSAPIIDDMGM